uniref:HORMA domain-containing protein n=1 Tax=Rhabditophanes sp. KR3021 TaxID=114890 RepID=A0AC35U8N0_9BILA
MIRVWVQLNQVDWPDRGVPASDYVFDVLSIVRGTIKPMVTHLRKLSTNLYTITMKPQLVDWPDRGVPASDYVFDVLSIVRGTIKPMVTHLRKLSTNLYTITMKPQLFEINSTN